MNMEPATIQTIVAILGTAINLIAMLISVSIILRSSSRQMMDTEVRNATRMATLETKVARVETDVQALLKATSKRSSDT